MTIGTPDPDERPRSKVEDEVLEILMKNDRPPSNVVKFQARVNRGRHTWPHRIRARVERLSVTTTTLLMASVALAIIAMLVRDASPITARVFAIGSFAALIALFVLAFAGPKQPATKRWRGRDIDLAEPNRPEWLDRWTKGDRGPRR